MLVYRIFPHLEAAQHGEAGHPLYEHRPQRGGRADHPDYYIWYLGRQPEAACGETFGNLARWTLYVNLTQDHCDGLIRDHLGEEVVAQASS